VAFPFLFGEVSGEAAVGIALMVAENEKTWTWLHSSRSQPVRLDARDWPDGLAQSVDHRNASRSGADKGRVLIVRHGPKGQPERLKPIAVLCWHAHSGNWPLAVLDLGYVRGLDKKLGRLAVTGFLLAALAELNDHPKLRDKAVPRPADKLAWAVRRQDGAGSDPAWARTVARRSLTEWGFAVVKQKSKRPPWARSGFYAERPR
jgi:hypothetical protein